jgi:hypothetical protein
MSPRHARSVGLIPNIQTGHVSPQFHWKADSTFTTVTMSGSMHMHQELTRILCIGMRL